MARCLHCTGWAFEHVTSDERILYCGNCGWEHRELLLSRRPRSFKRTPARPQRGG